MRWTSTPLARVICSKTWVARWSPGLLRRSPSQMRTVVQMISAMTSDSATGPTRLSKRSSSRSGRLAGQSIGDTVSRALSVSFRARRDALSTRQGGHPLTRR